MGYTGFALIVGGERGIRTPGGVTLNGFQDRRDRPLCHLSSALIGIASAKLGKNSDSSKSLSENFYRMESKIRFQLLLAVEIQSFIGWSLNIPGTFLRYINVISNFFVTFAKSIPIPSVD